MGRNRHKHTYNGIPFEDDDPTESGLEREVLFGIRHYTVLPTEAPEMQTQYLIEGDTHPFDFAWIERKLLLEVQGGIWTGGAHARGKGIVRDHLKACRAAAQGWRVLYFNTNFADDPLMWLGLLVEAYGYNS